MTPNPSPQNNPAQSNAQSTGPKTAAGKAASSRNAMRHGLTGRIDRVTLGRYLSVILNKPNLALTDFAPVDELGQAALALASAEVRLLRAQTALQEHLASTGATEATHHIASLTDDIGDDILKALVDPQRQQAALALFQALHDVSFKAQLNAKSLRLMNRYLREAQTGRTRALRRVATLRRKRA